MTSVFRQVLRTAVIETPAFVLDESQVLNNLQALQRLRQLTACKVLYAIKALPLGALLRYLHGKVDGFAVSSLFEARLAHQAWGGEGMLHLTTPGLRQQEFSELAGLCSHIAFNSLSQYTRLHAMAEGYSPGLRINPQLSFLDDDRYDPCRSHSKLGIGLEQLGERLPPSVEGLHFHTVFGYRSFTPLLDTMQRLLPLIEANPQLRWLNIGGGYRYDMIDDLSPLIALLQSLQQRFGLAIYLEPGKAIVSNAGYLLTRVVDRFVSEGKTILVLDTSVNHHPEVFEYQRSPVLLEDEPQGLHGALLVGSTCKAGDVFGEYRFSKLPEIGEHLTFSDVGAYSLIKANRFNGYDLPDVYVLREGTVSLQKRYGYEDYRQQWC